MIFLNKIFRTSITISVFIIISTFISYAQEVDTVDRHYLNAAINGSINRTSEGFVYMSNNSFSYSYKRPFMVLNTRARFIFGESLGNLTNRDYSGGLDCNWYFVNNKKWYGWVLGNGLSSFSLKINHQFQGGGGFAYNVWDQSELWLNISNGLLFEQSEIIEGDGGVINYSTLRNSLRVSFGYGFGNRFLFKTVNFWQPSLHIADDYILSSNSELRYKIFEWLQLNTQLSYNMVSRTNKENLLFTYGIILNYSF